MFELQLLISFIVGGLFIALQTLIGERTKGMWRSIVLTIPSTSAMGLLFIGLTKTAGDVVSAAVVVPAATVPAYVFVVVFALLSNFGIAMSYILSLFGWLLSAYVLLLFPPQTFLASTFIYSLPILIPLYLFIRRLPQEASLKQFPMNFKHIVLRSLFGGFVVALVVVLAKTLGNVWGGLFSAFPASYTSTLLIYYHLQGSKVIPAVVRSLFFPGIFAFYIYAWVVMVTFPVFGIWLGTLFAYCATMLFYAAYYVMLKRAGQIQNLDADKSST